MGLLCSSTIERQHRNCFAIFLGLWLISAVFSTSLLLQGVDNVTAVRLAIILCMLLFDFVFYGYRTTDYRYMLIHAALVVCFGLLAIASLIANKQYWLPQVIAIAFCARNIDTRTLVKTWMASILIAVGIVLLSCLIGLIPDYVTGNRGLFNRHSLGFNYSTYLSHYYLAIVLCVAYLRKLDIDGFHLTLFTIVDIGIYLLTDSRNSFFLVLLVIIVCMCKKIFRASKHSKMNFTRFLLKYSVVICFVVSVIIFLCFDPSGSFGGLIDKAFSSRASLTHTAYSQFPITLLGSEIPWSTPHYLADGTSGIGYLDKSGNFTAMPYLYVDCSYLNSILENGILSFAFMMLLITALSKYAVDNNDLVLAFGIAVIAMHSIIDPQLWMLHYNPFLLLLAKPWFSLLKARLSSKEDAGETPSLLVATKKNGYCSSDAAAMTVKNPLSL